MSFIPRPISLSPGDIAITTKKIENANGYFTKGTIVKVLGISDSGGYDITDSDGNIMLSCPWSSIKRK